MPRRVERRRSGVGMPVGMSVLQGGDVGPCPSGQCPSGRLRAEVTPGGVTDLSSSRTADGLADGNRLRPVRSEEQPRSGAWIGSLLVGRCAERGPRVPVGSCGVSPESLLRPATPTDARLGSPDGVGWSQARGHASRPGSGDLTVGFPLAVYALKLWPTGGHVFPAGFGSGPGSRLAG